MSTIIPERLAELDSLRLDAGHHETFASGHCAMEVVAWLVGDDHTDRPSCVPYVLADFARRLNDAMFDDERGRLREVLVRLIEANASAAAESRRYRMLCDPANSGAPAWPKPPSRARARARARVGDIDAGLVTECSSAIAARTRCVGAASLLETYLAPSTFEEVATRWCVENDEPPRMVDTVTKRLRKRAMREDDFADYRALRTTQIDAVMDFADRLIDA